MRCFERKMNEAKYTVQWAEDHNRKDVCGFSSKLASTTNTQLSRVRLRFSLTYVTDLFGDVFVVIRPLPILKKKLFSNVGTSQTKEHTNFFTGLIKALLLQ